MAYIDTGVNQPGIVELLFYKGASGEALSHLAHTLLHGPSPLSKGDRELIAGYVSNLNDCAFCHLSHTATANVHLNDDGKTMNSIICNLDTADISDKMKSLLKIAAKVQISGKEVLPDDIQYSKSQGASDEEIHDTVLIAAAFCMFNRYVDGLGTRKANPDEYAKMGKRMAKKGYKYPPKFLRKFVIWMMDK